MYPPLLEQGDGGLLAFILEWEGLGLVLGQGLGLGPGRGAGQGSLQISRFEDNWSDGRAVGVTGAVRCDGEQ